MSDRQMDITRRKVLGALGAVGAAGAGAGFGTSALFNDTESFENNSLVAGELDLKVDWQQTYSGPNPGNGGTVETHPVNAYPDEDGDGRQSLAGIQYASDGAVFDAAQVPACCDCDSGEYYVTYAGESYCVEPLSTDQSVQEFYDYSGPNADGVRYSSLKDGIQREDTATLFLYEDDEENLSLVIVNDDKDNADGGSAASFVVEGAPTANDWLVDPHDDAGWKQRDDAAGDPESGFDNYQIGVADWVWTTNRTDGGALGYLEDDFALRISADFNDEAELSGSSARGPGQIERLVLLSGGSGADSNRIVLEDTITESGASATVDSIVIHSACGIESGTGLPAEAFQSANYPNQQRLVELSDVKPGDSGEITFSLHLCDNPGYLWLTLQNFDEDEGVNTEPEPGTDRTTPAPDESGDDGTDGGELAENTMVRIWYDEDCDNQHDDGETLVFGPGIGGYTDFDAENEKPATLRAAVDIIQRNGGRLPLDGDPSTTPMTFDDGATSANRDCLPGETGLCIGVEWWVPEDVGNVIQGDSASFDLGFYTEQCRNNDGSGPS